MDYFKLVADKLVPHAHKPWAVAFIFLLTGIFSSIAIYSFALPNLPLISWSALLLVCLLSLTAALITHFVFRLPKCPEEVIGFLLAIRAETDAERFRLKNDFYESIKQALNESGTSLKFKVFLLPYRLSNSLETAEEARELTIRCNMRFGLYGDLRTRNENGNAMFVLRISSFVTHTETNDENQQLLQLEMNTLLPMEAKIDCKNELAGFEMTSRQFAAGSSYIISIPLFLSGQLNQALDLLAGLYRSTHLEHSEIQNNQELKLLIPKRLTNFLIHKIHTVFWQWRTQHQNHYLEKIEQLVNLTPVEYADSAAIITYKATASFLLRRDVKYSEKLLQRVESLTPRSASNQYSLAFLSAYEGDLDQAYKFYRAAFSNDETEFLSIEVEEFIARILEEEPERYQLHFCLGLINFRIKKDFGQAKEDFLLFIEKADKNKYSKQIQVTQKYLLELENK